MRGAAGTQELSSSSAGALRAGLPWAGLLVGAWAMVAPYVLLGPDLNAEGSREVVDHVVPGVLLIGLSCVMAVGGRRGPQGGNFPLLAGFGVLLAGLWMTATHLPLVTDARQGRVSESVAAWHTVPGLVVMVLGAVWAAMYWSAADQPAAQPPASNADPAPGPPRRQG